MLKFATWKLLVLKICMLTFWSGVPPAVLVTVPLIWPPAFRVKLMPDVVKAPVTDTSVPPGQLAVMLFPTMHVMPLYSWLMKAPVSSRFSRNTRQC